MYEDIMDIYVVEPGDTLDSIRYVRVSTNKLIQENELTDPSQLVPGQMIVIVSPVETHTVLEGETLESIAAFYNISISEILRNNQFLADMNYIIYPGLELNIRFDRAERLETYGYTNSFIDRKLLVKTLPYLTYLAIFNYQISDSGQIIQNGQDSDIVELATQYGVLPLLHLSAITVQGEFDVVTTYKVLTDENLQDIIIENILDIIRNKGYYGVIISAQYINDQNP